MEHFDNHVKYRASLQNYLIDTGEDDILVDAKRFTEEEFYEEEASLTDVRSFVLDIRKENTDSLRDRFTALFARLPYSDDERQVEQNFQNVIYIVFMLLGQYAMTEIHSSKGRADCIAETDDYVYLFEFKRDKSAEEALQQIEDTGYAKPYAADQRTILKIGVNFDSKERSISGWEVR